ncbi:MAG: acetyl-CoA carboxylase biotin carboxylase subunit [Candidatus Obscuribacterales bacterium]|nr:acetyl-CoA carboxylase biotin carboxylase subunit [Candidatus Obscuribacterales bacterium]
MSFKKVLIANRGEIAVRVISALREMGIKAVSINSTPDKPSSHVQLADESYELTGPPNKVYLDGNQIIEIAKKSGAQAIHPGYGFLAENAEFAEACAKAGITFIGPNPEVIRRMGSKVESRRVMEAAGVPVVPGTLNPVTTVEAVKELGVQYGYPLAIKASAGGGGRGMRVVRKEEEIESALSGAQREGSNYFGSGEVYVEKYLDKPRHIEIQILGDSKGNVVHLFERDCSSQRRHQKLLEESPGANLSPALKQKMFDAAVAGAKALGYTSAGTIECLVFGEDFYFLEVNTRVQVEHPITEAITGIDIVKEQIRIAYGEPISFKQSDVSARGHAIECRINAEDPFKQFMPAPGKITTWTEPRGAWVRVDSACYQGYEIQPFYDSLLAKLIVWGRTREEAIARTKIALKDFVIEGVATTIPFHLLLLEDKNFVEGRIDTMFVERDFKKTLLDKAGEFPKVVPAAKETTPVVNAQAKRVGPRNFEVNVNQKTFSVAVTELVQGKESPADTEPSSPPRVPVIKAETNGHSGEVKAEMHGLVKELFVKEGQQVTVGQKLLILEAMKMESEILAKKAGIVKTIKVKAGETVESASVMLVLGDK